jgi:hypothetical protein
VLIDVLIDAATGVRLGRKKKTNKQNKQNKTK